VAVCLLSDSNTTALRLLCYNASYRPGGLTLDPALGVAELELNQGDDKSGRIARADVADICVNAIFRYST
jgi:hypothetical protein